MTTEKIVCTIEARMSSTRLPGKVLLPVMGEPVLLHLLTRLKSVSSISEIVLATTINSNDDVLEDFASQQGINCYRGSEDDVMARVIAAAESVQADIIVEITGDDIIVDPQLVEQTIRMFMAHNVDYCSNSHIPSYPMGMGAQVFRLSTLKHSASMTDKPLDHEHVTLHIRQHPELFKRIDLIAPPELHWPELGLTLDEPSDYKLLKKIIEHFTNNNPLYSCLDVINLLHSHQDWLTINSDVTRKGDS